MLAKDLIKILQEHPDFDIETTFYTNMQEHCPCKLTLDDIGHSDKKFCFGIELKNHEEPEEPEKSNNDMPEPITIHHDFDAHHYLGNFINVYVRHYITSDGSHKAYEMISRKSPSKTGKYDTAQAICMAVHNTKKDKILLLREFRLAVNQWVYNFPCGLIDDDELPEDTCKRELKEETGLDLIKIIDMLPPHFTAVGFSDETVNFAVATAEGMFTPSTSVFEQIQSDWYTKEQVKTMLKTELFAGRTQVYCYLWANNKI